MFGTARLDNHAIRGGAILGLLIIKPQLALLIPLALVASRNWRALLGGFASSTALLGGALVIFGLPAYSAFIGGLPRQAGLANGGIPWVEMASVFAALQSVGAPTILALGGHAVVTAGAAVVTWVAWSRRGATRVPILAAATLLVPPYVLAYDTLLLMVPIGWLLRHHQRPGTIALLWFLCLTPVASWWGVWRGPNLTPVAAVVAIYAMLASDRAAALRPSTV
jgi:hypothetical protein